MDNTVVNAASGGETVLDRVIRLLGKQTATDPSAWSAATTLDEAGVDSFDFIEYVFLLEDEFGIEIQYNHNDVESRFVTIGDVATAVAKIVADKTSSSSGANSAGAFA